MFIVVKIMVVLMKMMKALFRQTKEIRNKNNVYLLDYSFFLCF